MTNENEENGEQTNGEGEGSERKSARAQKPRKVTALEEKVSSGEEPEESEGTDGATSEVPEEEPAEEASEEPVDDSLVVGEGTADGDSPEEEAGEAEGELEATAEAFTEPSEDEDEAADETIEAAASADAAEDEDVEETEADEEEVEEPEEKLDLLEAGTKWLEGLFEEMNFEAEAEARRDDHDIHFDIAGPDSSRLLGLGGMGPKSMEGIETIMRSVFSEYEDSRNIYVDVGGARDRRKSYLQGIARDLSGTAKRMDKTLTMSGLNSFERRIIHQTLRDDDEVETKSVGSGIFRRLQVKPR